MSAGLLPNPRLETAVDAPTGGADADVVGYGVGILWNVTPLLSRRTRRGSAEAQARSVDLEVTWQEWQVAQAARQHGVRVIYLTRRAQWARQAEDTWEHRSKGLGEAAESGAATALEVMSVQLAFHRSRLDRLALEQQLAAERVSLNEAIGVAPEAEIRTDLDWRARVDREIVVRNKLSGLEDRRPDLVALRYAFRSRDLALQTAMAERFPPIEIGPQYRREVDDVRAAGVGVTLALPFFDRAQGAVARGHAERSLSHAKYEARLAQARADVVRIARQVAMVRLRLQAAAEAAQAAAQLAQTVQEVAKDGSLDILVAADADERAYAARLREVEIEQEFAELEIAYDTAAGTWDTRR